MPDAHKKTRGSPANSPGGRVFSGGGDKAKKKRVGGVNLPGKASSTDSRRNESGLLLNGTY